MTPLHWVVAVLVVSTSIGIFIDHVQNDIDGIQSDRISALHERVLDIERCEVEP